MNVCYIIKILLIGVAGFICLHVAQPGNLEAKYADTEAQRLDVGFEPRTPLAEGLSSWAKWYLDYKKVVDGFV